MKRRTSKAEKWRRVVFAAECDAEGNCPHCNFDYADCPCPGPTQDEMEYRVIRGVLHAREARDAKPLRVRY